MKKPILVIVAICIAILSLSLATVGGYLYSLNKNKCNKAETKDNGETEIVYRNNTSSDEVIEIPSCPTCEVCSSENVAVVTYQTDTINLLPEGNFGITYEYISGRHIYKGIYSTNKINEEPLYSERELLISDSPITMFNGEPSFTNVIVHGISLSKTSDPMYDENYYTSFVASTKVNYTIPDSFDGFCYEYKAPLRDTNVQTCVIYIKNMPNERFSLTLLKMENKEEFQHMVETLDLKTGSSI